MRLVHNSLLGTALIYRIGHALSRVLVEVLLLDQLQVRVAFHLGYLVFPHVPIATFLKVTGRLWLEVGSGTLRKAWHLDDLVVALEIIILLNLDVLHLLMGVLVSLILLEPLHLVVYIGIVRKVCIKSSTLLLERLDRGSEVDL